MGYFGRKKIFTDVTEITRDNVLEVLRKALITHWSNKADMEYLYAYYKGRQPVLNRQKEVRPEIKNTVVENRANEIVSFKVGYLMGEPIQYVSRSDSKSVADKITTLNGYCLSEDKAAKDKELADWFHICGTAYRMVLPDSVFERESDEAPFEIYTLDPRFAFVVYANSIGEPPVMGVKYIQRSDGAVIYSIYTKDRYFEVENQSMIVREEAQSLGIPIIEYPANNARLGAFEIVLPLLDAINTVDSNRLDGVEQFVQALMLFHNVDIFGDDFAKLRDEGAIKFKDEGVNIVCIPGTIDRDVACSEYTLGFDTAANTAMEAIDKIRDSSVSHGRCSVVEVMGRKRGYIALWAGMATSADAIVLPEKWDGNFDYIINALRKRHTDGRNSYLVVVAEGVTDAGKLADLIQKETGIESRVSVLGYIQRGGQPTAKDRMYGSLMGAYAIEILRQGRGNRIVAIKNDILVDYDIAEAIDLHNNNLDSFQYQLSLMLAE